MHLYADENAGAFPVGRWSDTDYPMSLEMLYPEYTDNRRVYICPSMPFEPSCGSGAIFPDASYVYQPGLTTDVPGYFYVVYDKPGNHDGRGINVLRVDSFVEWWPASRLIEFRRRLALQTYAIDQWRASGKPVKDIGEFISPELKELMDKRL